MKVALLGAESTGKTALAEALATALSARGEQITTVPEHLRHWCKAQGRTPLAHEQMGIAAEHAKQVDAATTPWVIADTTSLMVAIYSELLFGDRSLYPMALAHQRSYDITLVTGLDLPWVADGLQRDGPHVRAPVDALLRTSLASGGIEFQVVYGSGKQRLQNALVAIDSVANYHASTPASGQKDSKTNSWAWFCEHCGDSACERHLFTAKLGLAAAAGPKQ